MANFKHLGSAVKAVLACGVVGVLYGAVAGAAFGTIFAPIVGTVFGFFFGAIGGAVFGLMGGSIGGPLGWGFAGCVGGLISSSLLNSGRPQDAFALAPAVILGTIGLVLSFALRRERPALPLIPWLKGLLEDAIFLRGMHGVHLLMGVLAVLWGGSILHERFTAPPEPSGLIADD